MSLITIYSVKDYVNDEKVKLSRFIEGKNYVNHEFTLQICRNRVIKSWIYSSISENINFDISKKEAFFDTWKSLKSNFANTSRDKVIELKLLLQLLRKDSFSQ